MKDLPTPSLSFLFSHPAHFLALGFGSGLSPLAAGTAGTLCAWLSYPLLRALLPDQLAFAFFLLLAFALGVAACHITGQALGQSDHGSIVWDEIVPFWTVLAMIPTSLAWQLAAFIAFRLFDIVKPPPARWVDAHMKNGLGVMLDDVVAAGYTLLTLALLQTLSDQL